MLTLFGCELCFILKNLFTIFLFLYLTTFAFMEKSAQRTEISNVGEFGLIDILTKNFETKQLSTIKGIGDDGAILDFGGYKTVVTTDILVEGIHFDLSYCPLHNIGYKAVAVNVSDICAMNAVPTQILVSIAISNRFSVEAVEEIYKGVRLACEQYKIDLVGGDTTASNKGLIINVVALGKATLEKIAQRNNAKEGDLICVTGDLGGAYIGLQILEREKKIFLEHPTITPQLKGHEYIIERQLKPEARIDIIEYLNENDLTPSAMIDISDGLSSEILHICKQSNVGCVIEEENVPIANETYNTALELNIDPINCVLSGGEDYELLFTIDPKYKSIIDKHHDISIIGEILDANLGVKIHTKGDNYHSIIAMGWNSLNNDQE